MVPRSGSENRIAAIHDDGVAGVEGERRVGKEEGGSTVGEKQSTICVSSLPTPYSDRRAGIGERPADGEADTAVASGDESDSSCQVVHEGERHF